AAAKHTFAAPRASLITKGRLSAAFHGSRSADHQFSFNPNWNWRGSNAAVGRLRYDFPSRLFHAFTSVKNGDADASLNLFRRLKPSASTSKRIRSPIRNALPIRISTVE